MSRRARRERPATEAEQRQMRALSEQLGKALSAAAGAPSPARRQDALRRALSATNRAAAALDPSKSPARLLLERLSSGQIGTEADVSTSAHNRHYVSRKTVQNGHEKSGHNDDSGQSAL